MIYVILGTILALATVFFIGRDAGKDSVENDDMKQSLDDIGLAKRVREDEKKIIEARDRFTRDS